MSESIFTVIPPRARRTAQSAATARPTSTMHTSTVHASSHDAHLLAILDAPLRDGEPAQVGFLRKEAELRGAFAGLPVLDARAILARLSNPRPGDRLAAKFAGLVVERRTRLLSFLADARRRAAIAAERR
jgi:hypothetical protein